MDHLNDRRSLLRPPVPAGGSSSISIPSVHTTDSRLSSFPLLTARTTSFDDSQDHIVPNAAQWNQYLRRSSLTSTERIEMETLPAGPDVVDGRATETQADRSGLPVNPTAFILRACPNPPKGYPKLDWRPSALSTWALVFATAFTAISLASVVVLGSLQYHRQSSFHTKKEQNYFVVRYLPTLVASVNRLWMQAILTNLGWMAPYIAMSRKPGSKTSLFAPYYSGINLVNLIAAFRDHEWLLLYTWVQYVLAVQLGGALKANFLSTVPDENGWTVQVTISSAKVLTIMYTFQLVGLLVVSIKSSKMSFGLAESVASVADQINLMAHSNILAGFEGLDWDPKLSVSKRLRDCHIRIGYWHTDVSDRLWYGIGTGDKTVVSGTSTDQGFSARNNRKLTHWMVLTYHPITVMVLTALSSLLTALLGYHIYLWHWKTGVHVYSISGSAFPSIDLVNIYFRFLPVYFVSQSIVYWAYVDRWFRKSQIFASMRSPSPAERSLLLEYPYDLPGLVTLKALKNKHWKVAWLSTVSLSASFLPTLVGGIFTALPSTSASTDVNGAYDITVAPGSLIATFVLLSIHTLTIPLTWHGGKRRAPRPWQSIGDVFAMCYRSYILQADAFDYPAPDDRRIHMQSRIHLSKQQYAFGKFAGIDGEEHIGFDVASLRQEDGRSIRHVEPLSPEEQRLAGWFGPRRRRLVPTVNHLSA